MPDRRITWNRPLLDRLDFLPGRRISCRIRVPLGTDGSLLNSRQLTPAEIILDVGENLFAEAVESLDGAACGNLHAVDFRI